MMINDNHAVNPSVFKKLPYDTLKDFAMVSTIGAFSIGVLVSPESPVRSVKDLIAQAKATPGKLNFGSINIGTTQHLSAELLKSMAAIDVTTVPFNNTAGVLTALRGGSVQAAFEFLPPVIGQIEEGFGTVISRMFQPGVAERATMIDGSPEEVADKIIEIFKEAGAL